MKRVININLIEKINGCTVEKLFNLDFNTEDWIWVNKEIFSDLIMNIVDYDSYDDEDHFTRELESIKEEELIQMINSKMKKINWIEVNQILFEKLESGFKATDDIKTYIFANRKYFMLKMIGKSKELQWMLRAMAVDYYQHVSPEGLLNNVYEEDFKDNSMILEEILTSGMYQRNNCIWKVVPASQALVFYKNGKQYRVWAEGNANFVFSELIK